MEPDLHQPHQSKRIVNKAKPSLMIDLRRYRTFLMKNFLLVEINLQYNFLFLSVRHVPAKVLVKK